MEANSDRKENKIIFLQIARWTFIGLLLRVMLMPFTMHGQDLQYINYFPMLFVTQGIWDPYGFIMQHFPACQMYYGPAVFLIMSVINFITLKLFNIVSLAQFLAKAGQLLCANFTSIDYMGVFSGNSVFWDLFLLKMPYLLFDFAIGYLLLRLSGDDKPQSVRTYIFWMLNIVVLHGVYATGQFELIPAFFTVAAFYAALRGRPHICVLFLSLGGASKLFPYVLVLPVILLLGKGWGQRLRLFCTAAGASAALYFPFIISSGTAVFGSFVLGRYYMGATKWALYSIFALLYSLICLGAVKDSKRISPARLLIYYFLAIGFLVFAVTPVSFRYFVFLTPFLALIMPKNRKLSILVIVIIVVLAFLRLPTREVQFGLFVPLGANYLTDFPAIQEIVGRFINLKILYCILSRALLLLFLLAAHWVWQIKITEEYYQQI